MKTTAKCPRYGLPGCKLYPKRTKPIGRKPIFCTPYCRRRHHRERFLARQIPEWESRQKLLQRTDNPMLRSLRKWLFSNEVAIRSLPGLDLEQRTKCASELIPELMERYYSIVGRPEMYAGPDLQELAARAYTLSSNLITAWRTLKQRDPKWLSHLPSKDQKMIRESLELLRFGAVMLKFTAPREATEDTQDRQK